MQDSDVLVSLVIPVYNAERYLDKCLNSVIGQTYKNLEIICVNDGSTDRSLSILNEYASIDDRISVLSKENEGAAIARNLGLKTATGEYIQFVDSDDFFESIMVETLLEKAVTANADVVICRGQIFDDIKQRVTGSLSHPDLEYAPDQLSFTWEDCREYICEIADNYAWNKLFKRQFLLDNDLCFMPIRLSEDHYISMIAPIVAGRVAVVDIPLINYRKGTGTSLCDRKNSHPEGAYEGIYPTIGRLKEMGVFDEVKRSYLNVTVRLMREYFDSMTEISKIRFLYDKYIEEVFPFLDAMKLPEGYFHDYRVEQWYKLIMSGTLEEILFKVARSYGGDMTTAPLRFQVPFDKIERNSRIVLVGKGIAGRYWYSQLILSDYCEVVCWTDSENKIPRNISYDAIITAR